MAKKGMSRPMPPKFNVKVIKIRKMKNNDAKNVPEVGK